MNTANRIALWDAINRVVAASGGNPGNTSVARQHAVVEVERIVAEIETAAVGDARQCEAILAEQACPEGYLR